MSPVPSSTVRTDDSTQTVDSTTAHTTASRPDGGAQALPSEALDFAAKVSGISSLNIVIVKSS